MGNAFVKSFLNRSAACISLAANTAMALEASIGDPPPIPIIKFALNAFTFSVMSSTVSILGLFSTESYTSYAIPAFFKTFVTSSNAPLAFAECFPVTMAARDPQYVKISK